MLTWLKNKAKGLLGKTTPSSVPVIRSQQTVLTTAQGNVRRMETPGFGPRSIQEMRDDLLETEYLEETQSVTRRTVRIIRAGTRNPTENERRVLDPREGLVTDSEDFLLQTCDGRLTTNLQGGGQCSVCSGYTDRDRLTFCALCRQPLCFSCYRDWQGAAVCPRHYRQLRFNHDTWMDDR